MYNRVALGSRIKAIREKRGETQAGFGKHFTPSVSRATVSRWESGNIKPNSQRLREIAKIGNVTVEFLVEGDNTTPEEATKLLDKIVNQSESVNEKDEKRLNEIQLELKQKLRLHDNIEKSNDNRRKVHLLNDLQSEVSVLNKNLNYSSLVTLDQLLKLFNFLNDTNDSSNLRRFGKILWHIRQIAEGTEPYNKKKNLSEINEFLTSLRKIN